MKSTFMIAGIFLCALVSSVYPQYPPWLLNIGNTTNREYYITSLTTPVLKDFAEAKFECHKYSMKLAVLDAEGLSLVDNYLKSTYGEFSITDPYWTSAHFVKDFSQEIRWFTNNEIVTPDQVPFAFRGPLPGESHYVWHECPPLIRDCLIGDSCGGHGCCVWKTRLFHTIQNYAASNCLYKRGFICHKDIV